jgi:16S rRNA (uracil1498-N3)-methyltransferase
MRAHRFYVSSDIELKHNFWLHDERLLHQWRNVLRFKPGQQVVLFDGMRHDRLYELTELKPDEAHLSLITEFERKVPNHDIYLLWTLLKKDKNDWVLQKCTELGVSHFLPLLVDRSEKVGFDEERAKKIVIEAAEQCGRSDIPTVREPMHVATAIEKLKDKVTLLVCEQSVNAMDLGLRTEDSKTPIGVLVGPEGGWSDTEKELFKTNSLQHLVLHDFTLRAETACVTAISKLL